MTLLTDKVMWITGASSGIGEGLAYAASHAGAKLVLSARGAEALERVREHCGGRKEDVLVLPLDLEDISSLSKKAEQALAAFGRIDVLVNNGGVGTRGLAVETRIDVDEKIMKINYLGHVALTKAVLPTMLQRKSGHIVVITSINGYVGVPGRAAYAASKHALHGFFDSLRGEVWRDNIKVTIICPGFVRTEMATRAIRGDGTPRGGETDAEHEKAMPVEAAAAQILKAIARSKEEVYIGGPEKYAVYVKRFLPGVWSRVSRRVQLSD